MSEQMILVGSCTAPVRSVLLNFFVLVLSSGCTPLGKHCLFFWPKGDKGEHEKNQPLGTRWVQCAQEKEWRWF